MCPRHPDRESYVRCQRCMRPTCPECQRPAAVGIQCVDCVAEGRKTVRQGRTVFGGAPTDGRPLATMTIIGICVAVFLAQYVPGVTDQVTPSSRWPRAEPWRFLTSAFAHGSLTHIAFNMYALWVMGTYLEPMLGRARFVAIYLLSALGGSVMYLLLSSPPSAADIAVGDYGMWWTRCRRGVGGGVRPVRRLPRAPAAARALGGRHVRGHRHQRRHRVRPAEHRLAGPPRRAAHRARPPRPRSRTPGATAARWRRPRTPRCTGSRWAASSSCSWCSPWGSTPSRPDRRPVDYTRVIRPQWGQPLWTTRVRAGQRQRVVIRKPESIRPKPTPRFQRPRAGIGYWCTPEM